MSKRNILTLAASVGLAVGLSACMPPPRVGYPCNATPGVTTPDRCMWWVRSDGAQVQGPASTYEAEKAADPGVHEIPAPTP